MPDGAQRVIVNVGCGPREASGLPAYFDGWRQVRVDADPRVEPEIVADLTDLSAISDQSADVVWASHCIEHLFEHQVKKALQEFRRVLRDDGFLCVIVPDLQAIAGFIAADRLHETLYMSAAGPVTPHDMLYGFGAALARGQSAMAHHCGFTPGGLQRCFQGLPFGEVQLRRRPQALELIALARTIPARNDADRESLLSALEL